MLNNDIAAAITELQEIFPDIDTYSENRQMALVDMIFNLGRAGFSAFKKTIEFIKAGEWEKASIEMLDSKWAAQVGIRAKELAWVIKTG